MSRRLRRPLFGLCVAASLGATPPAAPEEPRVHQVRPGETLWSIAATQIGDPLFWPALYRANRDQIKDPSLLYPGQKLAIPQLDESARAELRREGGALGTR